MLARLVAAVTLLHLAARCAAAPSCASHVERQTQPTQQTAGTVKAAAGVRVLGRVKPGGDFTWSGTGVDFSFQGSMATITLSHVNLTSYVKINVDDAAPKYQTVTGSGPFTLSTGNLTSGTHRVVMRKLSEGETGNFVLDGVKTDGTMLASKASPRRIEFVGDSITDAFGVLNKVTPQRNSGVSNCDEAAYEDVTLSYAALASDALQADYSAIAWSGMGMLRNGPASKGDAMPSMPFIYTRYSALDREATYTYPSDSAPAAVVIALGTNDFARKSYEGNKPDRAILDLDKFKATYVQFIKFLQARYAGVQIFICNSPMLSDVYPTAEEKQHTTLGNALADIANSTIGVTAIDFPVQDMDAADLGCYSHPGPSEHKKMAQILIPVMQKVLKWQ